MADILTTVRQMEEIRNELHNLLIKDENMNSHESITLSKELDEIINLYYQSVNTESPDIVCMICSEKMRRKPG